MLFKRVSRFYCQMMCKMINSLQLTDYASSMNVSFVCVVQEYIHTPTEGGNSCKNPPPLPSPTRNFQFLNTKTTPHPSKVLAVHPITSGEISNSKCSLVWSACTLIRQWVRIITMLKMLWTHEAQRSESTTFWHNKCEKVKNVLVM